MSEIHILNFLFCLGIERESETITFCYALLPTVAASNQERRIAA